MIIKTQTIKGSDLEVNIADGTLTIQQGTFAYKGPCLMMFEGKRINYLESKIGGKQVRVGISVETGNKISAEQYRAEQAALEAAVPGITLLEAAHYSEAAYLDAFNRMMEDEHNDGVRPPKAPAHNTDELSKQYPRAALYIKADAYSAASHDQKSAAGNKAKRILSSGGSEAEARDVLNNWLGDTYID